MRLGAWGSVTFLLLLALFTDGWWIAEGIASLRTNLVVTIAVLIALCLAAGLLVNSRVDGILIDDRNRISLERFQWTAWLIVLISGFFVETAWNISHGSSFPIMQGELYALLGIVSASPIVSNVIVDTKKNQPVIGVPQAVQPLASGDQPIGVGAMDVNKSSEEASWADLYLGEEVANRYVVDISRLQKLIITILLILSYVGLLWHEFGGRDHPAFSEMPKIGDTFVWLLGISHASYLAFKATPKKLS